MLTTEAHKISFFISVIRVHLYPCSSVVRFLFGQSRGAESQAEADNKHHEKFLRTNTALRGLLQRVFGSRVTGAETRVERG